MNNKTTTLKCNDCKDCLKMKCDVYKSREFKKAWDNLMDTLGHELKIYKLLDFLSKLLSKRT